MQKTSNCPSGTSDDLIVLSTKQYEAMEAILSGKSVFYTGAAGTGKSFILKLLLRVMLNVGAAKMPRIAITAATGIASCNIGGQTIHSWAGIGYGDGKLYSSFILIEQIVLQNLPKC